ncbi:MAG: tetratricopeptide repeat protein [Gammaproteobacteria bacterium]|nr:tetratricopeptide repeat protein [Gammaproteobacteria bacterium]
MVARPHPLIGALALALAIAGCTVPVYEPPPLPPVAPAPAPPPPPAPDTGNLPEVPAPAPEPLPPAPIPPPPPPPSSGATAALLEQGRQQAAAGNYAMATSSLERALRINPRDADLWCELGRVKLRQGDAGQAQNMAQRGLAVAGNDPDRRARCEALLAAARRSPL